MHSRFSKNNIFKNECVSPYLFARVCVCVCVVARDFCFAPIMYMPYNT